MRGAADTLLGREVAGYLLINVLGNGGMSTVYLGRRIDDPHVESAIKVLRDSPRTTDNYAAFRARFYREAETAASLQHEHILSVLDYGEWRGLPYMVMPLATAGTLGTRIAFEAGHLALPTAAEYAIQLASALDYAHQHGIVHRDVKPSNVLLDGQGRLLLADFGIAHLYESSTIHVGVTTTLTSNGEVLGTPSYMAPEQFKGQRVGPAADIYALGVVLYLLATGRLPFEGESPIAVGMAHLRDIPLSPRVYRPDLPVPAAAAILSALTKNPKRRFTSAGALAQSFAAGVAGSWTEENREHASSLDPELTDAYPVRSWRLRRRLAARPSLRAGLATLAAAVLVGGGIVAAQALQNEIIPSERPAFHSAVINPLATERTVNPAANRHATKPLTTGIFYRGSQVYAQRSDGKWLWSVWTDGALAWSPLLRGDLIYVTTVTGSRYILRADDGAILSLVTVATNQGNENGNSTADHQGNEHGTRHSHHSHHGDSNSWGSGQGANSNND
jgi:serine/threonine protein kinase